MSIGLFQRRDRPELSEEMADANGLSLGSGSDPDSSEGGNNVPPYVRRDNAIHYLCLVRHPQIDPLSFPSEVQMSVLGCQRPPDRKIFRGQLICHRFFYQGHTTLSVLLFCRSSKIHSRRL